MSSMLQTTRHLVLAAITLSTCAALPAASQTITENQKLTATDAISGDLFGSSIAIDNGIIAIGSRDDTDNGSNSGSAYLFDASGTQLFKLLPNDGADNDLFGSSIAMADGIVAIGSREDDDNGSRSGSAYLFDSSTGAQLAKLFPNDGAAGDKFGISIAIANGVVAVGASSDDDNGDESGSAYLFDASTGEQLFKLLPNDGAESDFFGFSIAIDNGIVAVGALWDDDNGINSGSVYLFDVSTGTQLAKLLPDDGAANDRFGDSIAIDNGVVAVGATQFHFSTQKPGSAYLFDAATGTQIAKLLPSDGHTHDRFGVSIAIDNGVVAVGAVWDDDNDQDSGSAYLYDATTGQQITKLLPSDGVEDDFFGNSIAIENGIVAVSAWQNNLNFSDPGSAYIFDVLPSTPENIKVIPSDGQAGDFLGRSIAIDNTAIAVGAWKDDDNGTNSGSAYILDPSTGDQLTKLLPADPAQGDQFGNSIEIDSGIAVVGAWRDDENGVGSGSAYIFDASNGAQLHKLLPNDGTTNDRFGRSIAIDNGLVAVGSFRDDDNGIDSGSAYLFDTTTGSQLFKLLPIDGESNDQFGYSIAIDNNLVAIGAINHPDNDGINSGSAYLFDASTGTQLLKLLPSDGATDDRFGSSIAISNGIIAVGAYQDDDNGTDSGSVYLFDANTGTQITKLLPRDGAASDFFGFSVSIDNGIVAVGNYNDDFHGTDSGSAYLFDASTGSFIAKLLPTDGAANDEFGYSIAIANGIVAVGALRDDDNGTDSGSVYVFDTTSEPPCPADLNADGNLNFADISAFLVAFGNQDPIADFFPDGLFNFFDVSEYLIAYGAGCP